AAAAAGGVGADGGVGRCSRAAGDGGQAPAIASGGVSADGAVGQDGKSVLRDDVVSGEEDHDPVLGEHPAAEGGRVAADGAVGQRGRAPVAAVVGECGAVQ